MRLLKLVPIVGFSAISLLSSSAIAQELWAINCEAQLCLDATGDGVNASVQVSECKESLQALKWVQNQPSPGNIKNVYFDRCLDMNTNTSVVINECREDALAQHWTFGAWRVRSEIRNAYWGTGDGTNAPRCVQVENGKVNAAVCNGQNNQMWYWVPVGETKTCPN